MFAVIINILSAFSFTYYGLVCLMSKKMVDEFQRFGLSQQQRIITGVAQLTGSIGLLIGLQVPLYGLIAAMGLTVLMFLGFLTRLKIRDSFTQSLPSFIFMLLNAYLVLSYLEKSF